MWHQSRNISSLFLSVKYKAHECFGCDIKATLNDTSLGRRDCKSISWHQNFFELLSLLFLTSPESVADDSTSLPGNAWPLWFANHESFLARNEHVLARMFSFFSFLKPHPIFKWNLFASSPLRSLLSHVVTRACVYLFILNFYGCTETASDRQQRPMPWFTVSTAYCLGSMLGGGGQLHIILQNMIKQVCQQSPRALCGILWLQGGIRSLAILHFTEH